MPKAGLGAANSHTAVTERALFHGVTSNEEAVCGWLGELSQRLPLPSGERGTCFDLWRNTTFYDEASDGHVAGASDAEPGGGLMSHAATLARSVSSGIATMSRDMGGIATIGVSPEGRVRRSSFGSSGSALSPASSAASPAGRARLASERREPSGCVLL